MFQALGRCTSSTQAGHNLNQFETFLHLHLSSHIFTIRISLIIFHGFHRDCQNCACGNILFSRSSLFWFSTFNFLPEFSEQALGDDSALTKTKTVMYIQHRTSGERNTVWMGWMDQPWSLKPDGIHICHCLLPAMASHGNCCPSDVVLGVDHAAKNQGASSHLAKSPAPAWIKAGAGPEIHEIPNLGDLEISWSYDDIWCHMDTSKSALCQQNDGDEDTGGYYFWNQRYPTIRFFSTRHSKRTLLTLRNVLACACCIGISKAFAKPSDWQMHSIGGNTISGRKPAASPGRSSHPPGWVRAKSSGVLRSTIGVEGCHANKMFLFHLTL